MAAGYLFTYFYFEDYAVFYYYIRTIISGYLSTVINGEIFFFFTS